MFAALPCAVTSSVQVCWEFCWRPSHRAGAADENKYFLLSLLSLVSFTVNRNCSIQSFPLSVMHKRITERINFVELFKKSFYSLASWLCLSLLLRGIVNTVWFSTGVFLLAGRHLSFKVCFCSLLWSAATAAAAEMWDSTSKRSYFERVFETCDIF